ncbi:MAG TPA: Cro/CI family transcriptional regulator [Beijerinckiaceae bacterium]|jgi:TorA maturation chaperone TorD/DNA-binding transcriptional regulator YdaS (Cro superfamily)
MRDEGLDRAIKAAGGVAALARMLGISQPSVSGWSRIPAERVLAVEALTKVPRSLLRSDLYESAAGGREAREPAMESEDRPEVDEIDRLRAAEWGLLAVLMGRAPSADLLDRVARLTGDATELGMAHIALGEAAAATDETRAGREYFDLFIGVGRGEFLPYGSYYLTGFLHERPLARLREDLARLGVERDGEREEPEDHVAILCEVMSNFASGAFEAPLETQRAFFEAHVKPWAIRFFADLEMSSRAEFYRAVGRVGRVFLDLESEAFTLPA